MHLKTLQIWSEAATHLQAGHCHVYMDVIASVAAIISVHVQRPEQGSEGNS